VRLNGCRILSFRGYGTPTELHVSGRVLKRTDSPPVVERFETDEIASARVRVRIGDHATELETDGEGQYRGLLRLAMPLTEPRVWHPAPIARDFGVDEDKLVKDGHDEHKLGWICRLFDTYSNLPFVLLGDCGQSDPHIYSEIADRYPRRLRAVYPRSLGHRDKREVVEGVAEIRQRGVPALILDETTEAAGHAAEVGLL
jgi:hypothetical protein